MSFIDVMYTQHGGGSTPFQFSTDEQKTNLKWLDGSDIYTKTYELTNSTSSLALPSNVAEVLYYKGVQHWNNSKITTVVTPYYGTTSDYISIYTSGNSIVITKPSGVPITSGYITIYYTKTT